MTPSKIRLTLPMLPLVLLIGCTSVPPAVVVPCPKPEAWPAELKHQPRSPAAIQALNQLLGTSSQPVPKTPHN